MKEARAHGVPVGDGVRPVHMTSGWVHADSLCSGESVRVPLMCSRQPRPSGNAPGLYNGTSLRMFKVPCHFRAAQLYPVCRPLRTQLVIATGKARGPWTADVLLGLQLDTPGVFMQGLIVYDDQGRVLHERRLCEDVARDCITLAADVGGWTGGRGGVGAREARCPRC